MKEQVIPIKGMHCKACEITLGQKLEDLTGVSKAKTSLKTKTATIYAKNLPSQVAIRKAVQEAGYDIGYESKPWISHKLSDYKIIFYGLLIITAVALILKYTQLTSLDFLSTNGRANTMIALLVGLTAGLSTCMALVGGMVLGLSARHAEKHPSATPFQKFRPHLFFNGSRIISFFILGGFIGLIGSLISLTGSMLGILTIFVGIVMLIIGLQLTELFPRLSNGGLTLPSGFAKALGIKKRGQKEYSHKNAIILGALSFFLPCGFTQAMQLLAISTGSFMAGSLIMGMFAIGTTPGLLAVGGLTSVVKGQFASKFFKVAGVIVVVLAIYNINNGYTLTGWPRPLRDNQITQSKLPEVTSTVFEGELPKPDKVNDSTESDRILRTTFWLKSDIIPNSFTVNAGETYTLEVDAKENGEGCMSTIMIPGLNNEPQYIQSGNVNKLKFVANRKGVYEITCAMGVKRGTITVI